jgi:hypothetical protein
MERNGLNDFVMSINDSTTAIKNMIARNENIMFPCSFGGQCYQLCAAVEVQLRIDMITPNRLIQPRLLASTDHRRYLSG